MGLLNSFRIYPTKSLSEEIALSLSHLLSTKQTYGAWQKELGIADYSNCNESKAILQEIADDIAVNIRAYEKRFHLKKVNVFDFKGFNDFSFELVGDLEGRSQIFYINISNKRGINVTAKPESSH